MADRARGLDQGRRRGHEVSWFCGLTGQRPRRWLEEAGLAWSLLVRAGHVDEVASICRLACRLARLILVDPGITRHLVGRACGAREEARVGGQAGTLAGLGLVEAGWAHGLGGASHRRREPALGVIRFDEAPWGGVVAPRLPGHGLERPDLAGGGEACPDVGRIPGWPGSAYIRFGLARPDMSPFHMASDRLAFGTGVVADVGGLARGLTFLVLVCTGWAIGRSRVARSCSESPDRCVEAVR